MKIAGFVMIAIGFLGLTLSLIDLEALGTFRSEEAAASKSDGKTASDPAAVVPAVADQRAAARTFPNAESALAIADDERPIRVAKPGAPSASESLNTSAVTTRSPASVKVFGGEDGADQSAQKLWADIAAAQETVSEGSVYANFLLTLSEPSDRAVVIIFSTVDLSAIDQEDYRSQRGTVTFEPGVVSAEIKTPLVDDDIEENDEQFAIVVNGAPDIVTFRNRRAAITIKDDDKAAPQ